MPYPSPSPPFLFKAHKTASQEMQRRAKRRKKRRDTRSQSFKRTKYLLFLPLQFHTHRSKHDHLRVPRLQHGPRRLRHNRRREAPEAKAKISSVPSTPTRTTTTTPHHPPLKVPAQIQGGGRRGLEPSSPAIRTTPYEPCRRCAGSKITPPASS